MKSIQNYWKHLFLLFVMCQTTTEMCAKAAASVKTQSTTKIPSQEDQERFYKSDWAAWQEVPPQQNKFLYTKQNSNNDSDDSDSSEHIDHFALTQEEIDAINQRNTALFTWAITQWKSLPESIKKPCESMHDWAHAWAKYMYNNIEENKFPDQDNCN